MVESEEKNFYFITTLAKLFLKIHPSTKTFKLFVSIKIPPALLKIKKKRKFIFKSLAQFFYHSCKIIRHAASLDSDVDIKCINKNHSSILKKKIEFVGKGFITTSYHLYFLNNLIKQLTTYA